MTEPFRESTRACKIPASLSSGFKIVISSESLYVDVVIGIFKSILITCVGILVHRRYEGDEHNSMISVNPRAEALNAAHVQT